VSAVRRAAVALCGLLLLALTACELWLQTPTVAVTPTAVQSPTPTATSTRSPQPVQLFHDYARGDILPDMRVPLERSASGESGWYTLIGTQEGWAQFLSEMGQPAEIWEPVAWDQEILIGALLGARVGRGYGIEIRDLSLHGVSVEISVQVTTPQGTPSAAAWTVYPFHLIRVPRDELPLGPVTFDFYVAQEPDQVPQGEPTVSQTVDMTALNIVWLPGEPALLPTPVPVVSTLTPEPLSTATPVPNVQVSGTVLDLSPADLQLRLLTTESGELQVDLMEATSILSQDGGAAALTQIVPGTVIGVLGYESGGGRIRAAHIDLVSGPLDTMRFAVYRPHDVQISTLYGGYALPVPLDAVSSTMPLSQTFGPTQTRLLSENGFLVTGAEYPSFEALYGDAAHAGEPVLVSVDSVLYATQRVLADVQREVERDHLLPELRLLDRQLYEGAWAQYEGRADASTQVDQRIASTALRVAGYFAVPLSVLDPEFTPPEVLSTVVSAELALIDASEAITISPAMAVPSLPEEDQLHVDYRSFSLSDGSDEEWARFWTALQWHRAVAFRPAQREEMRAAALIAWLVDADPAAGVLWQRIQSTVGFTEGRDASYTPDQSTELLRLIWEDSTDIAVLADEEGLDALTKAMVNLPLPEHPLWAFWSRVGMPERQWRFLAGTLHPDSYVLAQTAGEGIGTEDNPRDLPSYVDLGAALGAQEAYLVAEELGAAAYAGYLDGVDRVRNELASLMTTYWTDSLDWSWLYVYSSLVREKTPSYPTWMRQPAWKRKELQAVFGGWTQVRYAALPAPVPTPAPAQTPGAEPQPAAEGEAPSPAPWGYVQPYPEVYARLAALTRMVTEGLEERLMLTQTGRVTLLDLEAWLSELQDVARRELTGQAILPDEYARLGQYAVLLSEFISTGAEADLRVAFPVASGAAAQRIEALGPVDEFYLVVERAGTLYLARGGAYRYYEFDLPLGEKLTGRAWRAQLDAGEAPDPPPWVSSFMDLGSIGR
jgi:hypothetical protein